MEKLDQTIEWLKQAEQAFAPDLVFACSFGAEDVVLFDLIAGHAPLIRIVTLDTGRLPQQTYDLMDACREKYDMHIEVYFPDASDVEEMVREKGLNLFYHSLENRKLCCEIRKVRPLKRALKGAKAWVTGLRREQAASRTEMQPIEDDPAFGIRKFNPLIEWSEKDVWNYIRSNEVPYNKLHDQFYPSIGCAPCTRSVAVGEDPRSGRWWWENEDVVPECGLHANPTSKLSGDQK
ncbi:MAG: phosphoadenylyl-sulfate reductase [Mariprofundaceae bacterium]|nr:phosphoadenylyl-sulfate reductase [Mariprofundaceae bacterium]